MLQILDHQLNMSWPLWFLLFAFLARILGRDWLADGVASLVNLVRELFSVLCHLWAGFWNWAFAFGERVDLYLDAVGDAVVAAVKYHLLPAIAPVDWVAQQPDTSDSYGNENKKRERSEHGTERRQTELVERQKELIERQEELIELRIPLQPSAERSRTPMEETLPVIPNSQNDCQPQVRLPIYTQIGAGVHTVDGEIHAPSIVAEKDNKPVVNPGQRDSDSVDEDLEDGEYDEKLEETNDGDLGEADLQYHDGISSGAARNEDQNPMVPNDKLVTTSTSPMPQSLHGGNRTPIIVQSSPTWRPPGRC